MIVFPLLGHSKKLQLAIIGYEAFIGSVDIKDFFGGEECKREFGGVQVPGNSLSEYILLSKY